MKKGSIVFLLGTLVGAGATYVATTKREELLKKIEELQEQLKESDLSEKAKLLVKDITESIKKLVAAPEDSLSEEEKKSILEEVEEKINKLEETIQKEGQ